MVFKAGARKRDEAPLLLLSRGWRDRAAAWRLPDARLDSIITIDYLTGIDFGR
jgi:hypothetical protein